MVPASYYLQGTVVKWYDQSGHGYDAQGLGSDKTAYPSIGQVYAGTIFAHITPDAYNPSIDSDVNIGNFVTFSSTGTKAAQLFIQNNTPSILQDFTIAVGAWNCDLGTTTSSLDTNANFVGFLDPTYTQRFSFGWYSDSSNQYTSFYTADGAEELHTISVDPITAFIPDGHESDHFVYVANRKTVDGTTGLSIDGVEQLTFATRPGDFDATTDIRLYMGFSHASGSCEMSDCVIFDGILSDDDKVILQNVLSINVDTVVEG